MNDLRLGARAVVSHTASATRKLTDNTFAYNLVVQPEQRWPAVGGNLESSW